MEITERFLIVLKDLLFQHRNEEAINLIELYQKTYFKKDLDK